VFRAERSSLQSPILSDAWLALSSTEKLLESVDQSWLSRALFCAAAGATVSLGALLVYGTAVEPFWLEVTRPTAWIPDLPDELEGFVLAHLSDLHVPPTLYRRSAVWQAIEACNSARPDVVVLTGDYALGRKSLKALAASLDAIQTRPAFAVLGNHDYRFGPTFRRGIANALRDANITLLDNRNARVERSGRALWLLGVGDGYTCHDQIEPACREPEEVGEPCVLLTHYPDLLLERLPVKIDLALAGHTHGAQVRLPIVAERALRRSETRFVAGWYSVGGTPLYVNRGLGTSGYRIRIRARPELALVTLRRTKLTAFAGIDNNG
jgi:predicted MPP superfamily phosphohydrolase